MTALFIILGVSLALFVASLIVGLLQDSEAGRYCQYLMTHPLGNPNNGMHDCFHRAARRPAKILGTFIL